MKLQRWTTRAGASGPARTSPAVEDRAAALLRHAVVRHPLDARTLDEIRDRLPDERRAAPHPLVLRVAVAVALFLAGGGVVASATILGRWQPFRRAPASPGPAPASVEPVRRNAASPPPASEIVTPPAPETPRALPAAAAPERPRRPRPAPPADLDAAEPTPIAPAPVPPALAPSAIAEEASLVGRALRLVREHDDATGALALLDEREARFGAAGLLSDEARTTRVEALLRLGQRARALALLDTATPRPTGRGRAQRAARGELRADAGRCREAIADFDALLDDGATSDDLAERALYGRAACLAQLGETDAARADLEAYVERFPSGRNAARARAALER
jgi:hypothetical protein